MKAIKMPVVLSILAMSITSVANSNSKTKSKTHNTPSCMHLLLYVCCWLCMVSGNVTAQAALEGRSLLYQQDKNTVWQRDFAAGLGALIGPVNLNDTVYLGIGPTVYAWNERGRLLGRADLPANVSSLDASGGVVRVSVSDDNYSENFTLGEPKNLSLPVAERVVFLPKKEVTNWLIRAANSVPESRLSQAIADDPSNPFLLLRQAKLARRDGQATSYETLRNLRKTLLVPLPFYALTQLAVKLDDLGLPSAADFALSRARQDAAQRGIDPEIPISREALIAYGDPVGYIGTLLKQGRDLRAEVWMQHLRELHPLVTGSSALYLRYANQLEARGRSGEAAEWRQFDRSLRAGTIYNLGSNDTEFLRQAAKLAAQGLSLGLLVALLSLTMRSRRSESVQIKALGGQLRAWRYPLRRLRQTALAYAHLSERFMLLTLSVLLLLAMTGWKWSISTQAALSSPALNIGTYGGGWQVAQLSELSLRNIPETQFLRGLAAQLDDDGNIARSLYNKMQGACALNNLGVIAQQNDDNAGARELYRAALARRPEQTSALYNLGLRTPDPYSAFQKKYRPQQARICLPDRRTLSQVVNGDVGITLRQVFFSPFEALLTTEGRTRLNLAIVAAWLLSLILLLSLALPRTPLISSVGTHAHISRNLKAAVEASKSAPFVMPWLSIWTVFLPGTGLLRQPWGGMLLITWAVSSVALLQIVITGQLLWLGSEQLKVIQPVIWGSCLTSYALNLLALLWARRPQAATTG